MVFAEFIVLIRDFLFSMLSMVSTYIGAFFSMYIFDDISLGQLFIAVGVIGVILGFVMKLFKGGDEE